MLASLKLRTAQETLRFFLKLISLLLRLAPVRNSIFGGIALIFSREDLHGSDVAISPFRHKPVRYVDDGWQRAPGITQKVMIVMSVCGGAVQHQSRHRF